MELVSLLTPCYNMGKYIHRLLDSVLLQTYPAIEMIIVDDGSTDNSAEVINQYKQKFLDKGYSLIYVYQENQGQSAAIQRGLQIVSGVYLAWPDADDFYSDINAIYILVEALSKAPDSVKMVRARQVVIDEETLTPICVQGRIENKIENSSLFEDCLYNNNSFYWGAGAYMVYFQALKEMTNLKIFVSKGAGQNWQLLLPVLYKYRCLSITDLIYSILRRTCSHSRDESGGYCQIVKRIEVYEETLYCTLDNILYMSDTTRLTYKKILKKKYVFEKLRNALVYNNRNEYLKYSIEYKSLAPLEFGIKQNIMFYAFKWNLQSILFLLMKFRKSIKRYVD